MHAFVSAFTPVLTRAFSRPAARRAAVRMASSSVQPPLPPRATGIVPADLGQEMSRSYMEYAMSVILGRAMPDVRDGLKPVHRRILYAMHELGLSPAGQFRKSARVVGEVLGKYHPHGDTAVYDALVRMAQEFSMAVPLVDGHGNFGSTDGDPAAAMRYTECKLTPISKAAFLDDMGKDTVGFIPNFDGSESEPLVLPARVPNLLVNGSSGIAVGMATNIPPHNLGELVTALVALIAEPDISDERLLALVPGPDFPTGGQILGVDGSRDMHLTGRGRILVRACAHSEVVNGGTGTGRRQARDAIVITELPYQVNKATLVGKIAQLVNDKKLEGVADLRDESDRNGTRIVIELRRDAKVPVVLNNLYKKTQLQSSFSANIMALDNGRFPVRLTLRDCLSKFLTFRRETVRRRVAFELKHAETRQHLVLGFLIAQQNIDAVVEAIRGSSDPAAAKHQLMALFGLSRLQSDAVLAMQLRRLTSLEFSRLETETASLSEEIADKRAILSDPRKVDSIITAELKEASSKFAPKRRSAILRGNRLDATEIDELSLMANDRAVIVVSQQGYIKRMPTSAFESQNRGTRGKRGMGKLRKEDAVAHFFSCMTHDSLLVISKSGVAYDLPAHKVPLSSPSSRGVPVFQVLPAVPAGETVASVIPVTEYSSDQYLVLLTRCGFVKRTPLSGFKSNSARGKIIINLDANDELKWVGRCTDADSIIIASQLGYVIRFRTNAKSLRASGRFSRGVRSMRLVEGDAIADMAVVPVPTGIMNDEDGGGVEGSDDDDIAELEEEEEGEKDGEVEAELVASDADDDCSLDPFMLAVTVQGTGKRMRASSFRPQRRGGRGVIGIKLRRKRGPRQRKTGPAGTVEEGDRLVALQTCDEDSSVMVVTRDGTIVRTRVGKIPIYARNTQGVRIQKLGPSDTVAAVAVLPRLLAADEDEEEDGHWDDDGEAVEEAEGPGQE